MPKWELSCKVYVGNLGNTGCKIKIGEAFSVYGPLRNIWVARKPAGFAFIEFEYPHHAKNAVRALNGALCCGTYLKVEMATGRSRWEDCQRDRFGGSPIGEPNVGGGWFDIAGGSRWFHSIKSEHHYCRECRCVVGGWRRYGEDRTRFGDKMFHITDKRRRLGGERLYISDSGPSVNGRRLHVSYAGSRLGGKNNRPSRDGQLAAYDKYHACENKSSAHGGIVRFNGDVHRYSDGGRNANWFRTRGFHTNDSVVYGDGSVYRSLGSGNYRNLVAKTKSTNQNLVLQLPSKQDYSELRIYRPVLPRRRRTYPRSSLGDKRAQSDAQGRY